MLAVLEFSDFFWIWCVVALALTLYAGGSAAYARSRLHAAVRLHRLEAKVDLLLRHFGLEYKDLATPGGLSEEVKALAEDPAGKLAAIKLLREQTGLGLKEAVDAVDSYIAGRR
jgi:hypothetical protein